MKRFALLFLTIATALTACKGQSSAPGAAITTTITAGDTVLEMDKALWIVFEARNGNYWFGSDGQGVYRYDGKNIVHFSTKHGLCNDRIREIKEDKAGTIFITTLKGISKYEGQKFTTLPIIENKPAGNSWKLEPGDLWFKSTEGKNGPLRYDGKVLYQMEFPRHYMADEYYKQFPNLPFSPYDIYSIYKDKRGAMWFGTASFGLCRYDGKSLSWLYENTLQFNRAGGSFGVRSVYEDKQGKFWICNNQYRYTIATDSIVEAGKTLLRYTKEKGIENMKASDGDWIYYMNTTEDKKGDLWLLTYADGVWRYDGKNSIQYLVKEGDKQANLISMYKDSKGVLWLGTQEAGAYKFNGSEFEKFRP